MERTLWVQRTFQFDLPPGWMQNVTERLYGTYPRLLSMLEKLNDSKLINRPPGSWSIKEHIGHLGDLETLHEGRIDDFITRKPALRAADMGNKKTEDAHHNIQDIRLLLSRFEGLRLHFIHRLLSLDDETQLFQSLHPRLKVPMRPVDMAYFTAEHDDHHLASIRALIRGF